MTSDGSTSQEDGQQPPDKAAGAHSAVAPPCSPASGPPPEDTSASSWSPEAAGAHCTAAPPCSPASRHPPEDTSASSRRADPDIAAGVFGASFATAEPKSPSFVEAGTGFSSARGPGLSFATPQKDSWDPRDPARRPPTEAALPLVPLDDFLSDDAPVPNGGDEKQGSKSRFVGAIASAIREANLWTAEKGLDVRESREKAVSKLVNRLAETPDEKENKDSKDSIVNPTSQGITLEKRWRSVCAEAHKHHSKLEPDAPETSCGQLEVKFMAFGPQVRLEKRGWEAAEPVLQLLCEDTVTGAMYPADSLEDDPDKNPFAVFHLQELAHCDLQVCVWDRKEYSFATGWEDSAFCGGAFVPLLTIIRQGKFFSDVFEARVKVQLLPLELVRMQRKLRPSDVDKPQHKLGHVFLHMKIKLKQPALKLLMEPYTQPPKQTAAHVSNPVSIIQEVAEVIGRVIATVDLSVILSCADELRESPSCMLLLQVWLAFTLLRAPVASWPVLAALPLPLLSWRMNLAWTRDKAEIRLYVDKEAKNDGPGVFKSIAAAEVVILDLAEKVNNVVATVERCKFGFSVADQRTSLLFCVPIFLLAVASGVVLQLVILLGEWGFLRPLIWISVAFMLLPLAGREEFRLRWEQIALCWKPLSEHHLVQQLSDHIEEEQEKQKVMARSYLLRIPDLDEATHLQLCEKFAVRVLAE